MAAAKSISYKVAARETLPAPSVAEYRLLSATFCNEKLLSYSFLPKKSSSFRICIVLALNKDNDGLIFLLRHI